MKRAMKLNLILCTGLTVFGGLGHAKDEVAKPQAETLLKDSDRARGAAVEGISWSIEIETIEGGDSSHVKYNVKAKGNDALAEVTAPARQKGEMMLFNDRSIWFFKPGLKKPVSISPRQKLMGQAANGDIASTNYFRDYEGVIVGDESVNGVAAWKLDLKAKAKNVTYDKIRYWISKDKHLGVKAEFLTVSGDLFKSAAFEYKNSMKVGGKEYPFVSKMEIFDAINKGNKTIIVYSKPREQKHSDSLFNINNLIR